MLPALKLISDNYSGNGVGPNGNPTAKPGNGADHKTTLLIVEDEVLIRMATAEYLRDSGYRVLEASNADEARMIFQAGEPIEMMFSDVNMPGDLNGFALARWVRQTYPDVKVLLTSGASQTGETASVYEPLVQKPYVHTVLLAHIKRVLAR